MRFSSSALPCTAAHAPCRARPAAAGAQDAAAISERRRRRAARGEVMMMVVVLFQWSCCVQSVVSSTPGQQWWRWAIGLRLLLFKAPSDRAVTQCRGFLGIPAAAGEFTSSARRGSGRKSRSRWVFDGVCESCGQIITAKYYITKPAYDVITAL